MIVVRIAILFTLLLVVTQAQDEETKPEVYSAAEWSEWRDDLSGFDEIVMTLAIKTIQVPTKMVGTEIQFQDQWVLDSLLHQEEAVANAGDFIKLLEFQPNVEKSSHGCYGLYNLYFYKKGVRVGHLHFAHGRYWFPLTEKCQQEVNKWLEKNGFPINETIKNDRGNG